MIHPVQTFTRRTLSMLRDAATVQGGEAESPVASAIYISRDREEGDVETTVTSEPGQLIRISGRITSPPRWLSLSIPLGEAVFRPGDILGLVAEVAGDRDHALSLFVRTGREGNLADTPLGVELAVSRKRQVVTLLQDIEPSMPLAGDTGYHTLVAPLPWQDFVLDLLDLRVFVVPAERGLRSTFASMDSFAV